MPYISQTCICYIHFGDRCMPSDFTWNDVFEAHKLYSTPKTELYTIRSSYIGSEWKTKSHRNAFNTLITANTLYIL